MGNMFVNSPYYESFHEAGILHFLEHSTAKARKRGKTQHAYGQVTKAWLISYPHKTLVNLRTKKQKQFNIHSAIDNSNTSMRMIYISVQCWGHGTKLFLSYVLAHEFTYLIVLIFC